MEIIWSFKNIDPNYYCSTYYDFNVNKYGVKCEASSKFWKNNGWINSVDPYGWFQWCFRYWIDRGFLDDKRQIVRLKRIVSRFKGKLVKMIEDANGTFDYYFISPKIRQILLHWGYELVQNNLLWLLFFIFIWKLVTIGLI